MHTYRTRDRGTRVRGDRELQEQTEQAPLEFRDDPAQGPGDTSTEQQPEGKPWFITYYFKL